MHISDGKLHDVNVLDILPVDRGYVDFERLYAMHQPGAFFVTRAKSGMDARRVYSGATDRASGVICDRRMMFNGFYSARNYPEHLRRIRFKHPESGKTLVFLTNNTSLPALTIAAHERRNLGIRIDGDEAATELRALADRDQPGVVFRFRVHQGQQFLQHHSDFHAIWRAQRIQLERMATHWKFLVVRGARRAG